MQNSSRGIEKKIMPESFELPDVFSKKDNAFDRKRESNELNDLEVGSLSQKDKEKLAGLKLALDEALAAYEDEERGKLSSWNEIARVLGLKKLNQIDGSSFAYQKYQEALGALRDFKRQVGSENADRQVEKIAKIIEGGDFEGLLSKLKEARGEDILQLYGRIVSEIAKNIFKDSGIKSWRELAGVSANKCEGLVVNPKIVELNTLRIDMEIDDSNLQEWIFGLTRKILKFCGIDVNALDDVNNFK